MLFMSNKSELKILIWKTSHHFPQNLFATYLPTNALSWERKVEGQREAVLLGTRQTGQVKIVSEFGLICVTILTEKDHYFTKREIIFIFSQEFPHLFKK